MKASLTELRQMFDSEKSKTRDLVAELSTLRKERDVLVAKLEKELSFKPMNYTSLAEPLPIRLSGGKLMGTGEFEGTTGFALYRALMDAYRASNKMTVFYSAVLVGYSNSVSSEHRSLFRKRLDGAPSKIMELFWKISS